ncbi:MAG: hypothetical protein AB1458_02935 [Bacteroidota bacterium]
MQKIFIAALVIVLCSFSGATNYFEGSITYLVSYESKDPLLSDELLAKTNGDTMRLHFSSEKYIERHNGSLQWYKSYSFADNTGSIANNFAMKPYDGTKANEKLKSIEEVKTESMSILGRTAHLVRVTADPADDGNEHFTQRDYYFSNDLFIQPGIFDKCKYDSYDQIYSKTNTLPLKMVFENDAYKVTYTAIKIDSE